MIIIPHDQLKPLTIIALIEEFVTRNGAIHGHVDIGLHEMVAAVRQQLKTGAVVVVFDQESESASIVERDREGRLLVKEANERASRNVQNEADNLEFKSF